AARARAAQAGGRRLAGRRPGHAVGGAAEEPDPARTRDLRGAEGAGALVFQASGAEGWQALRPATVTGFQDGLVELDLALGLVAAGLLLRLVLGEAVTLVDHRAREVVGDLDQAGADGL